MAYSGRRTKKVARLSKGLLLAVLALLTFMTSLPVGLAMAETSGQGSSHMLQEHIGSQLPRVAGADPVPDLSLPRTILSSVESPIGAGGVIQTSQENLTLYNSAIVLRLLGGPLPHDELLSRDRRVLSSWSFWGAEVQLGGAWVPLLPRSNNFTVIGTNTTGTYLVRTMQVATGPYSGSLQISYKATSVGPLKWDLDFAANKTGGYRLVYAWHNITRNHELVAPSKMLRVGYGSANFTMTWNDVPRSFNSTATLSAGRFLLSVDLGIVASGSKIHVDPSVVGYSGSPQATAYTFQRKVFYEPTGGYYWAFFYDGGGLVYVNSQDGKGPWSNQGSVPCQSLSKTCFNWNAGLFNSGQTVIVADGNSVEDTRDYNWTATVYLNYTIGTISGSWIYWTQPKPVITATQTCNFRSGCYMTFGIRDVSVALTQSGRLAFSYNWFFAKRTGPDCPYSTSSLYLNSRQIFSNSQQNIADCYRYDQGDEIRSVILPSDSGGGVRVLYQQPYHDGGVRVDLRSYLNTTAQYETVLAGIANGGANFTPPKGLGTSEFSAVADTDYGAHVVSKTPDGKVGYAYHGSSGSWTPSTDIFSGTASSPTITVDYSTNDVYAFALQGSSIIMKSKPIVQSWSDRSAIYPVTGRTANPTFLGSSYSSASSTASGRVSLVWTEDGAPSPDSNTVWYAGIPIVSIWSPFASPTDPWDGSGIVPFGQYFANLGEYVSPNSGVLTVRQTDLRIPGRGLNLEITRVYVEPYSFLGGKVYNYEKYPWAPLGNGWQLNFPWLNNTQKPSYIHLWDGQGYRIPSRFWNNTSATFENHQGEHFRLVRNSTGIFLYPKSGISLIFDSGSRLTKIVDPLGNNITVSYDPSTNRISKITDTVSRVFLFCYNSNGLLSSIEQGGVGCGTGYARRVLYTYAGQSLTSVIDPMGRATGYNYSAVSDPNIAPWLLSRITYPTAWFTSYTYAGVPMGALATTTYRVSLQNVNAPSGTSIIPIRHFQYNYTQGPGDQVTNSTVRAFDGASTQPVSYTTYSFSFLGVNWNITDASHGFVRGIAQRFGVHGEVLGEIVLVSPTQSFTNFYRYDLWGSLIYSRKAINTNSYHESFNAYYNNGLPAGFYGFQDTFSQGNFTGTDNPWSVRKGSWLVKNGLYNGTETSGGEEDMLAWSDIGKGDISLQARVYVTRQVNKTAGVWNRVGIFGHYNSSGTRAYKWALVLVDNGTGTFLELLDEWNAWLGTSQPSALSSCSGISPLIAYGVWYTFNMTVHGYYATGSLSVPGKPPCNVSGNFPTSSPAATGTGFGLTSGGYSTLFDNVTVATVSPYITTTGFSNSFVPNGAPGLNIHEALAGTAELPDGTGSTAIESYFSYAPWGGLNLAKQRYDPATGTQWLTASKTYDGYGNLITSTDPKGNSTSYSYSANYQYAYLTGQTRNVGSTQVTTQYSYNFTTGTRTSVLDPQGNITTYRSDILDRPTLVNYPNNLGYAVYTYNDTGNYVDTTNMNAWKTRQIFDGLGRLSTVQRFLGGKLYSTETSAYNWQNKIAAKTDPLNNTYLYQYDVLGRTLNVTKPDRNFTLQSYNDTAPWARFTDENGRYRCNYYDRLDRLISVVENATSSCGPGIVTNYYYDDVGNLVKTVPSDYNALSNPGFETGDFTGWSPTGMAVSNVKSHSGSYSATPSSFSAYTLQENFSTPIPGSQIKAIRFWYLGGSSVHNAQVLYTDGTNTTKSLNSCATWCLQSLIFYSTKLVAGVRIVKSVQNIDVIYLDDFVVSASRSTLYYYDNLNRLTRTSYPDATSESYSYDNNGNMVGKVDRNGVRTAYSYDSLNRVSSVTYGSASQDVYSYDKDGNLLRLQSQNATLSYAYDARNRLLIEAYQVNGGTPLSASFTFSPTTPSSGATVTFTGSGSGGTGIYTYSWNFGDSTTGTGNPATHAYLFGGTYTVTLTVTDTAGNRATSSQTVNVTPGGGGSVAPGTLITLANGTAVPVQDLRIGMSLLAYNTTTSQYVVSTIVRLGTVHTDNMLIIRTEDPLTLKTDNATAQKLWVKRSDGSIGWLSVTMLRVGDYLFNALGQRWTMVVSITYVSGSFTMYDIFGTAPYDYIANGYLDPFKEGPVGSTSPASLTASASPATSGGVGQTYTVSYAYTGDVLDTITYPDGLVVKYTYDGLGRVSAVSKSGSAAYAYFTYYPDDHLKGIGYGNGLVANYTYTSLGTPSTLKVKDGGLERLSLTYNYYNTGTIKSVIGQVNGTGVSEQYTYDALQRLTNSSLTNGSTSTTLWYEYDQAGNRQVQRVRQGTSGPWTVTSYWYNLRNNELTSSSSPAPTTYSYYPDGSLRNQNSTTYTWDVPGHLLQVTNSGILKGSYAYDGMGRRIESIEASTTFYAYLGTETLYELAGTASTDYVYAAGLRVAKITSATINYYHADPLGSTRLVTNPAKTIVFSDSYQPFGQDNASKGSETYRFTGKPVSQTTGLYYDYQRWYDPSIGRFISQDPVKGYRSNPQTLNPYIYVVDSPLNGLDPTGLDCFSSLGDFGSCLWGSTIGAGINSYNWYQTASDADRRAFWTGVGVAVGIGLIVGASCVVAGCSGLALLAVGGVTAVGGSFAAGATYEAAGGRSAGGLSATMFWGGVGAGAGFGIGGWAASALSAPESEVASTTVDDFVSATSRFSAKFEGNEVSFPEYAARTIWNKGHYEQISEALGLRTPGEVVDSIANTINTGYRVLNPSNPLLYAIESDSVPLRVLLDPIHWEVVNAFPI